MHRCTILAAAFAAVFTLPAAAASSAASSASDSLTTSSGSVSTSLRGSSGSSTGNNVAEGDYRIIEVAAAPQRPGDLRLTLQLGESRGESTEGTVFLTLPQVAIEKARLGQGDLVTAKHRAYGVEFQDGRSHEAFFLVLDDDWHRELKTVPVPG